MPRDLRFVIGVLAVLVLAAALPFGQPLLVFGAAVDPAGAPIAGVLGTSHYRSGAADRAAKRGKRSFVSGCFLCAGLRLRVSAPGFETERIQLSAAHAFDLGDRVAVRRYAFGVIQHVTVTLYPERNVSMRRLESELMFATGTPEVVFALDPDLPQRMSAEELNAEVRRVTRGERDVAAYIALESDTAPDGAITVTTDPTAKWASVRRPHPSGARLVLHNADGGFVSIAPFSGIPEYNGYSEIRKRLREAPAAGYEPIMPIDFERAHRDGQHFYFYCRLGDRYGIGELTALEIWPGELGRLRAFVRIWLNDDGGRVIPLTH